MSRQNPITDLHTRIARRFGKSLAELAKTVTSLGRPRLQRSAVPSTLHPPSCVIAGQAASSSAEAYPTASNESASAKQSPTEDDSAASPTTEILPPTPEEIATSTDSLGTPAMAVPLEAVAVAATPTAAAPRKVCPTLAADPELEALRARVVWMETRVVDLETRKLEMEQLLDEYAFCQYQALGDLLDEQLRLQHELLQRRAERSSNPEDRQAADAAAAEYEAYQRAREQPAAPLAVLGEQEREELTALYRAAAMRCHPDRVGEAEKPRAHELFLRTQDAYRRRDLDALRLITRQLAATDTPSAQDDENTPKERLETLLEGLEDKGVEVLLAIEAIQAQAQYHRARRRGLWEDYFAAARERLEDECAALRRQISRC